MSNASRAYWSLTPDGGARCLETSPCPRTLGRIEPPSQDETRWLAKSFVSWGDTPVRVESYSEAVAHIENLVRRSGLKMRGDI
jgi:hypothetical protein